MRALGVEDGPGRATMVTGMRLIALLAIGAVPLVQVVLRRLLDLVETVRLGDPFVAENAARLRRIAWAVLAMEVLHFAIVSVARYASEGGQPLDIGWDFSLPRWITVLMLFVLAQVFEQGTRMREELEGTI